MSDAAELPRGIDTDDIERAKSSLAGTFLVRLAAMAVLLIAYAIAATKLGETLKAPFVSLGLNEFHQTVLVFGAPVGFVILWLLQEAVVWLRARRLRMTAYEPPTAGYFRISPYGVADHEKAYSRPDSVHETVLQWVLESQSPLLYLTGRSGCGKSSLVSAWLKPELEKHGWAVCSVRGYAEPLEVAANAIAAPNLLWQRPPNIDDPVELLRRAGLRAVEEGKRILIVIDQFEEFLILNDESSVARFRAAFGKLARDTIEGLTILLVFRSDYEDLIETLDLPLLRQGENWEVVGPFSKGQAMQFLRKGLPGIDESFLERLISGLVEIERAPGRFRPVTLNMTGLVLEREAGRLDKPPEQLIYHFVSEAIREPEIVEIAPQVLEPMITEGGTKRPWALQKLVTETGINPALIRGCLRRLARNSLVRSLDEKQDEWEISHDFLAQLIGQNLGRIRPSRWRVWMRWAAPTAVGLWALTLVVGGLYWQSIEVDRAKARLADLGLAFTDAEGKVVTSFGDTFGNSELREAVTLLEIVSRHRPIWELDLSVTDVSDLSPLSGLNELRSLNLSVSEISDLSSLSGLNALQALDLSATEVSDLSHLSSLKALQTLDLSSTNVSDLSPLSGLKELQTLDLSRTDVSDLSSLSSLKALQTLYLSSTKVSDLSPVHHVPNIQR